MRKFFKVLFVASATILIAGYLIPERKAMPCNPPERFNWRLMFWLNPTEHLPVE